MLKSFSNSFSIFIAVILLAVILAILFYFTYSEIDKSAKGVALGEIQNVSMTKTHDSGKIIEAHGGTIRGYNNQNGEKKGATFEFILPL